MMSDHQPSSPRAIAVAGSNRGSNLLIIACAMLMMMMFAAMWATDAGAGTPQYSVELVSQTVPGEEGSESTGSVADVAEAANPSVVTVYTFVDGGSATDSLRPVDPVSPGGNSEGNQNDEPAPLGAGSGWIFNADGYIVTNAHVVEGAESIVVQYHDGTQVEVTLVGKDILQDVAVLKLNLKEGETVPGVSKIGDSSILRAGDEVVAIGSPLGTFTNSVSDGNIGGLDRSLDGGNGTALANLIQHDAEISPGNSGGPLLNMSGEVIGMNVAKVEKTGTNGATATGLNFAIEGNTVVEIVNQIISTNGSIEYPYLGVQTQPTEAGLIVVAVEPGGPTANAGIREGDILIGVDGADVDQETSFMQLLLEHKPGDTVAITVGRNSTPEPVEVTLGVRPTGV